MSWAIGAAAGIGVLTTWLGVLLSYDSYYWGSSQNGWPVSFFIVAIVFVVYLASGLVGVRTRGQARRTSRSVIGG